MGLIYRGVMCIGCDYDIGCGLLFRKAEGDKWRGVWCGLCIGEISGK